jgi:hypothetical protein
VEQPFANARVSSSLPLDFWFELLVVTTMMMTGLVTVPTMRIWKNLGGAVLP